MLYIFHVYCVAILLVFALVKMFGGTSDLNCDLFNMSNMMLKYTVFYHISYQKDCLQLFGVQSYNSSIFDKFFSSSIWCTL